LDLPIGASFDNTSSVHPETPLKTSRKLILSIDRIDYTKGLIEKIQSLRNFIRSAPAKLLQETQFIQIASPTREEIPEYIELRKRCQTEVDHLKRDFPQWTESSFQWIEKTLPHSVLRGLYEAADVCWVNSLHDGMNLVAKEYLQVRTSPRSALLLSRYAGSSNEFVDSDLINPFDPEETSETLIRALENLQTAENQARFKRMRAHALRWSASSWGETLLKKTLDSQSPSD